VGVLVPVENRTLAVQSVARGYTHTARPDYKAAQCRGLYSTFRVRDQVSDKDRPRTNTEAD
jgi:hypothetical protein